MKILNNAKYIRPQQNLWKLCGEIHQLFHANNTYYDVKGMKTDPSDNFQQVSHTNRKETCERYI